VGSSTTGIANEEQEESMNFVQPIHIAVVIAFVAAVVDIQTRRIPNALTLGAAIAAFAVHAAFSGTAGLWSSAAGWIVGVALFFPFFALRGLGAGDVKLLAAIGAWLGPYAVLYVGLYSSIAGGVLAVIVALQAGYLSQAARNLAYFVTFWKAHGLKPVDGFDLERPGPRLAYAVPILTGVLVTLWLQ
jgi:prepilin peptidase CpaA